MNHAKRDKLPENGLVRRRGEAIVDCWRTLAGSRLPCSPSELSPNWEKPLLESFAEAIEYTATIHGAERWQP